MDGKSRSYMRAVCAVLAEGLLAAGCGKEETRIDDILKKFNEISIECGN